MGEKLYPYVIFLPTKKKQSVLRAIFRSKVSIDILQYFIDKGISRKVYQKGLIDAFSYSNKTTIERLKDLTDLGILKEDMEKTESAGRTVWVKHFVLTDLGKWFALLIAEEDALSRDEKIEIIRSALKSYAKGLRELSEKLGVKKEFLEEIFQEEMT
ncbi:MAG: hypothetical protein JSV58_03175 [Candidatus Bathyarchaeota archaeon]|nr:MAG: hypothetical protein JSV58_03175 [Candidatus Bathyarchaeota archaeon]